MVERERERRVLAAMLTVHEITSARRESLAWEEELTAEVNEQKERVEGIASQNSLG